MSSAPADPQSRPDHEDPSDPMPVRPHGDAILNPAVGGVPGEPARDGSLVSDVASMPGDSVADTPDDPAAAHALQDDDYARMDPADAADTALPGYKSNSGGVNTVGGVDASPGLGGGPANLDPISKEPGAHPVGISVGAAGGGLAAGALAGSILGPVGTVVGAAAGFVAGAAVGKRTAEAMDPTDPVAAERAEAARGGE